MKQLFRDFDLVIEKEGSEFVSRAIPFDAKIANSVFSFPFSRLELENFFLRLERYRGRTRNRGAPDAQEARKFGERLFAAAFSGEVGVALENCLQQSAGHNQGTRIRLRLDKAPELSDVPWEYLHSPQLDRFLALSADTPVVRLLDSAKPPRTLQITPPLKVLVMTSSPTGYESLDVVEELKKLDEAFGALEHDGRISIKHLSQGSLSELQRELRRENYHVFHYIGHGSFNHASQEGALLFEGDDGRGMPVSGERLGALLSDHHSLRVAMLNACEGARASLENSFSGVAQALVRQGIPAVIAMQFVVSDSTAIVLAHEFYRAMTDNYPVDAALSEARKAVFAKGEPLEWGTPVLYLSRTDALVFEVLDTTQSNYTTSTTVLSATSLSDESLGHDPHNRKDEALPRDNARRETPAIRLSTKRWFVVILLVVTTVAAIGTYLRLSNPIRVREDARARLIQLGFDFTPEKFIERVQDGDVDAVKLFLKGGMDPNARDKDGNIAMFHALKRKQEKVADLLYSTPGVLFGPGLHFAVETNNKRLFAKAIADTPTPESVDSALHTAAWNGRFEFFGPLLDKSPSKVGLARAFEAAASSKDEIVGERMMRLLLQKRVDIDGKPNALYAAIERKNERIVQFLLRSGASVNVRIARYVSSEKPGITPLMKAADVGDLSILKSLLEKGANVNDQTMEDLPAATTGKQTALMFALQGEEAKPVPMLVDQLLFANANVHLKDDQGCTAIMYAASHNRVPSIGQLVARGARLDERCSDGRTVLHYARSDAITALVNRGAEIDAMDNRGRTPLMVAAESRMWTSLKTLISAGALINAVDKEGQTALLQAIALSNRWPHGRADQYEIIQILLDAGARADVRDKTGRSALDEAKKDVNVLRMIKLANANRPAIR